MNYKIIKGFTLIELIIVIMVLAIVSVYCSVLFTNKPNLYAQAKLLADDLRYTQSLSMTHDQRYRFVKLSSTSYTIQNSSGTSIIMPDEANSVSLNSGITFGTLTGFTNTIVFDSRGVPYADSSTTPMSATATIPLNSGSQTISVTINPETGMVSP
jgi:MSHA pilin protein MshC